MAEGESEPKHPYVTPENARIHRLFSFAVGIMSVIQIIVGIVINELQLKDIISRYDPNNLNWKREELDDWYFADHIWVGFAGIILAIIGYSVYHTRSRANGIMLSVMCFFSAFMIYPPAVVLGGALVVDTHTVSGITGLRIASACYTGIQTFVIFVWAGYSAGHACCNSNVRTQTRLHIQQGTAVAPQTQPAQQVVYVSQPGQPVQYAAQPGQYPGGQPAQYVQGAPPGPPAYVQPVPAQVQHVQKQDSSPPAYTE